MGLELEERIIGGMAPSFAINPFYADPPDISDRISLVRFLWPDCFNELLRNSVLRVPRIGANCRANTAF
jgi:hypothetical protein